MPTSVHGSELGGCVALASIARRPYCKCPVRPLGPRDAYTPSSQTHTVGRASSHPRRGSFSPLLPSVQANNMPARSLPFPPMSRPPPPSKAHTQPPLRVDYSVVDAALCVGRQREREGGVRPSPTYPPRRAGVVIQPFREKAMSNGATAPPPMEAAASREHGCWQQRRLEPRCASVPVGVPDFCTPFRAWYFVAPFVLFGACVSCARLPAFLVCTRRCCCCCCRRGPGPAKRRRRPPSNAKGNGGGDTPPPLLPAALFWLKGRALTSKPRPQMPRREMPWRASFDWASRCFGLDMAN